MSNHINLATDLLLFELPFSSIQILMVTKTCFVENGQFFLFLEVPRILPSNKQKLSYVKITTFDANAFLVLFEKCFYLLHRDIPFHCTVYEIPVIIMDVAAS